MEEIACGYYEVSLVPLLDEVLGGGDKVKISVGCDCAICRLRWCRNQQRRQIGPPALEHREELFCCLSGGKQNTAC